MFELTPGTASALAAGAVLIGLLAVLLALAHRKRVAATRRLSMVAARLEQPGAAAPDEGDAVSRLEHLASTTVARQSDTEAESARLAGVLAALHQGVVVCDEMGAVVYRNPAADTMAGLGEGPGPARAAIAEVLEAATAGETSARTLELAGPPRVTITVSGHPLDDGSRPVGAVAVLEDVSEGRRLEQLRHDLLDNVTAELKAPAEALSLLADILVAERDPLVARRLAERVRQEARAVARLIDDVAELGRLEAPPRRTSDPTPVQVVVTEAAEEVRTGAGRRTITVDTASVPADLAVLGDRQQLVSAVRHLLTNAVLCSADDAALVVGVAVDAGWLEVAVRDQGHGATSELERILGGITDDPGPPPVSSVSSGSELALAIASRVAAAHGGELVPRPAGAQGPAYTLRLPVGPSAASLRATPLAPATAPGPPVPERGLVPGGRPEGPE